MNNGPIALKKKKGAVSIEECIYSEYGKNP